MINEGNRIAQLVIMPYLNVKLKEVNEYSDTKRRDGDFESTGVN